MSRGQREGAFSDAKQAKRDAERENSRSQPGQKGTSLTPPAKGTIVVHFYPFAPDSAIVAAAAPAGAR